MKDTVKELEEIVEKHVKLFSGIPEEEFSRKPMPDKWSKKEVLGHLIDSAHNNLRRFITGQYEADPQKIIYEQDFWVSANGYQATAKEDVIQSWRLVNQQIARTLTNMIPANYSRECDTGKQSIQLHTLQWLAEDYVRHMKHHINQIIPGSYDIVYS